MREQDFLPVASLSQDIENILKENNFRDSIHEFSLEMNYYSAAIKRVTTSLEILDNEFQIKNDYNPIHHIESRLKTPRSILEKMKVRGIPVSLVNIKENITDIAGIRVICNYIDDAYRIADMLLNQNDISLITRKDYISNPKPSGYRSLHLIVNVSVFVSSGVIEVPAEIQIRTIAMDYWATLEHRLKYKNKGIVPEDLHPKMKQYSEQLADMEIKMQEIHRNTETIK